MYIKGLKHFSPTLFVHPSSCFKEDKNPATLESTSVAGFFTNSFCPITPVGGVDFIRLSALKKLSDEEIRKVITNATILCSPATDNRMDLFLAVAMDPDAEGIYTTGSTTVLAKNDDKASQKKAVEVSIDFLWDQFNVGKDAGNPNYLVKQNKSEKR